jgi:hypothetical protein
MSRRSDLLSALEQESETLQNITDYFVPLMHRTSNSTCFSPFLAVPGASGVVLRPRHHVCSRITPETL